jgi:predicted transcriptional regulator of viral defense system
MGDAKLDCLFEAAASRSGYFTTAQARECGYSWALLSHHLRGGRFARVRRGLYRLRQYPSSPREEVMASWLAAGPDAVVSHESALDLLGLADAIPDSIHITIPRSRRRWRPPPGVSLHTTTRPPGVGEVVERGGIAVTGPARTILDVAEAGSPPDQVSLGIRQAIARGLITREGLLAGARARGRRVEALVADAVGLEPK